MNKYADPATLSAIYTSAAKHDVPISVYNALIFSESSYNPNATNPSGALGIAQFMPGTAKEKGIDPLNKLQSLDAGAAYLRQIYDTYGGKDWMKSIAYYKGYGTGAGGLTDSELNKVTSLMKQKFTEMSTIPGTALKVSEDDSLFTRTFNLGKNLLDLGSISDSAAAVVSNVDAALSTKSFFDDPLGYMRDSSKTIGSAVVFVALALILISAGVKGLVEVPKTV